MPSVFNIIRLSIFAAVLAWTLIVLGLASHLEQMLIANELTRFIPLSIFICACTLLIVPALLISGLLRRPLKLKEVRLELPLVGILGLLWLILGIYTAFEPDTEVECDFDGDGDWEESDIFSTDTYHAQYRTLEAFAIFNAILLIAYFFLLLLLSMKEHIQARTHVWYSDIVTYPWFKPSDADRPLPQPVTAKHLGGTIGKFQFTFPGTKAEAHMQEVQTDDGPMKAGAHYIIYIPPPPPPPPNGGRGQGRR